MIDDADAKEIVELYRVCSRQRVVTAMRWTGGDLAGAQEITQEAFHAACLQWRTVGRYDQARQLAWLRQVVRNKAVWAFRARQRLTLVDPIEDRAMLDGPARTAEPAQAVLARDLLHRCIAVIDTLPEHLRVAILLRCDPDHQYTSTEIGAILEVDASTVRGYWRKVIQELSERVGPVIKILDETEEGESA